MKPRNLFHNDVRVAGTKSRRVGRPRRTTYRLAEFAEFLWLVFWMLAAVTAGVALFRALEWVCS